LGKDKKVPDNVAFEADLENGVIRRKVDGARVMALGSLGWVTLESELGSTFVTGAAVILQRMGYSYGRTIARQAVQAGRTRDDVLDVMTRHAREAGWGKMSLNSGDMSFGQAHIVMRNCYFCLHWKNNEAVCYMLGGFIGGVADEMLGKPHRTLEQRCISKGDNVCEIAVDRVEA
jgi:predicted hydrocarbon binding protein